MLYTFIARPTTRFVSVVSVVDQEVELEAKVDPPFRGDVMHVIRVRVMTWRFSSLTS